MYWNKEFKSYNLTKNMRLLGITENANIDLTQERHLFPNNQRCYGDMILKIGNGRWKGSNCESENLDLGTQNIVIPNVKCITEQEEGLQYMYSNGFNTENFTNRAILACTNTQVDEWNNIIQFMNPSFNIHGNRQYCLSRDISAEVDDPYDILKEILVPEVLNTFNKNSIPPHCL